MPQFTCDLSAPSVPLHHVWSHTIGSNHARMTLRADWQGQMRRVRQELGVRYVRFHGILDDDMAVLLDEQDQQIYGFRNVDVMFDFLLGIGMKPFVELSFMPSTLASGDQTVFNYRANVTPPRDPAAWCTLIDLMVRHCIERYGLAEVRTWFFEVWNEPNLDAFWTGGQAGYFDLYKHTSATLKAIDAQLRVGGPATADNEWIPEFLKFCADQKIACDFICTHHYPTDALGKPGDDTEHQLALASADVLLHRTEKACEEANGLPVYYTEWSTTSNPFFALHDDASMMAMPTRQEPPASAATPHRGPRAGRPPSLLRSPPGLRPRTPPMYPQVSRPYAPARAKSPSVIPEHAGLPQTSPPAPLPEGRGEHALSDSPSFAASPPPSPFREKGAGGLRSARPPRGLLQNHARRARA